MHMQLLSFRAYNLQSLPAKNARRQRAMQTKMRVLWIAFAADFLVSAAQDVCDSHDPEYWPKFKKWCDDYFVIKHRNNERRGCGGIFFDDLNDKDADTIFEFSQDCQRAVVSFYVCWHCCFS